MRSASQRLANDSDVERYAIQTEVSTIIGELAVRIRERFDLIVAEVETAALQRQSLIAAQRFTHEPAQREVDGTSLGIESVHPLCGGHEFVVDLDVGP